MSNNRPSEFLGVNKIGKNIRKSPLHQPNFVNNGSGSNNNNPTRQQPQPHVYNISKNEFRSFVQQLTGSPSHQNPIPRHPSTRLQRIRPPPLTPSIPQGLAGSPPMAPPPFGFGQLSPRGMQPLMPNPALSPISAFMQQLQTCISDDQGPRDPHSTLQPQPQVPMAMQPHVPGQAWDQSLPQPRTNGPAPCPSPSSNFLLPSPSGLFNYLSPTPLSSYPLLSPGSYFPPPPPPPFSPNFAFSPIGQSGILGPGPQPPFLPGIVFPLSPSGFSPISSPRWRN